jgi:plastocyanin
MKILLTLVIAAATGWMVWPFGKNLSFFRQLESINVVNVASTPGPAPSAAGTITGRVSMAQAAASTGRASRGLYGKSVSRLAAASASRQAVVFVESVSGQFAVPQVHPAMRQRNITIVPRVLPILRGTTVDFPNEDKIFHNIFSLSPTRSFDLGRYAQGLSKSVTFDKVGEVKVFCDIHSTMSGFILVLQNPYYATTEQDGGYRISNVPTGTYRLGAWTESGINWQNVTVGGGETVTVNFNF